MFWVSFRLCLDRCPQWRCNHSLYSADVSFTGTRWRDQACVYLDQRTHIWPSLTDMWNLTSGQPERLFPIQTISMCAHLYTYRCIYMCIHTFVKRIRLHTHFSEVWLWARCLQDCTWLSMSKTRKKARERDIYVSKAAVKPLVSCFPFNVKRPPQRKASTTSTLLCCPTRLRLPTHFNTGCL